MSRSTDRFRSTLLLIIVILLTSVTAPAGEMPAFQQRMLTDLKHLASDELKGRCSGEEGLERAADYVMQQFRAAGLTLPAQDDDGFHEFTISRRGSLGAKNVLSLESPSRQNLGTLTVNRDFVPISLGSGGTFDAGIVFCGYGITSPEKNYDDFKGLSIEGKAALIIRRVPGQTRPGTLFVNDKGAIDNEIAALRTKIDQAVKHGAKAVIFVNDAFNLGRQKQRILDEADNLQSQLESTTIDNLTRTRLEQNRKDLLAKLQRHEHDELIAFGYLGTGKFDIPVVHIKRHLAEQLFPHETGLSKVEQQIEETLQPHSFELTGTRVWGELTMVGSEAKVRNVIGVLEGAGPLASETIIVGAHYDHVGMGEFGSRLGNRGDIHNGADDNASGTVLLMELARRMAARDEKLPRRIVFIAFAAEEMGLLGSQAYCKEPLYPLNQTVAMINFDMVGRLSDNRVIAFGTKTSTRWEPLLDDLEAKHGLLAIRQAVGRGPSDHQSFYDKGIPVLHFFTGIHGDYHTPADDWQKVNIDGIDRLVNLSMDLIIETARKDSRPDYVKVGGFANPMNAAAGFPFLGINPNVDVDGVSGCLIKDVIPHSPAEQAGLKPDDVIIALAGLRTDSPLEFSRVLKTCRANQTVTIKAKRGDEEILLTAKLLSSPQ